MIAAVLAIYVVFFLLAVAGNIAGAIVLLMIAGALSGMIVIALTPPEHQPYKTEITRAHEPELWSEVDRICLLMGTKAPDHIRLMPGQWAFAGNTHKEPDSVLIGSALAQCLTKEQFYAVVAHEIAHQLAGDARLAFRLERIRQVWARLENPSPNPYSPLRILALMMQNMSNWCYALGQGYTVAAEFAADELAAKATSPKALGEALVRMAAIQRTWLGYNSDIYWLQYVRGLPHLETDRALTPPVDALEAEMAYRAVPASSHPGLAERLEALGLPATADHWQEDIFSLAWPTRNPASQAVFRDWKSLASQLKEDNEKELLIQEHNLEPLSSKTLPDRLRRAIGLANTFRTQEAHAELLALAKENPDCYRTHSFLALLEAELGLPQARESAKKAVDTFGWGAGLEKYVDACLAWHEGDAAEEARLHREYRLEQSELYPLWHQHIDIRRPEWKQIDLPREHLRTAKAWCKLQPDCLGMVYLEREDRRTSAGVIRQLVLFHKPPFRYAERLLAKLLQESREHFPAIQVVNVGIGLDKKPRRFTLLARDDLFTN